MRHPRWKLSPSLIRLLGLSIQAALTACSGAPASRELLARMELVMGPLPGPERRVPLDVKVLEETPLEKSVRLKVDYAVEAGDRISAWLFLPKEKAGRRPAVLCLHPTNRPIGKDVVAGLGGKPNRAYALELAERGFVTLAPDYPNMGQHKFDVYGRGYVSTTMKAIWDNMRAVDLLQSLPEVDRAHIGAIGHSLGGHNSIFTAVFDERIKAVVSCCGFTAFARYYGGNLAGWSHAGYMPRIADVYGKDPKRMPFDFHDLVGSLAPRAFMAVAPERDDNFDVTGVREVMAAAAKPYAALGASDRLKAVYPDAAHDFPDAARAEAYAFLERWLRD
jgi:dienelactone hydrolase